MVWQVQELVKLNPLCRAKSQKPFSTHKLRFPVEFLIAGATNPTISVSSKFVSNRLQPCFPQIKKTQLFLNELTLKMSRTAEVTLSGQSYPILKVSSVRFPVGKTSFFYQSFGDNVLKI